MVAGEGVEDFSFRNESCAFANNWLSLSHQCRKYEVIA